MSALSVSPDGRTLARSAPKADSRHDSRGAVLAAEAEGFARFTNRGPPEELVVYRLARDGRVLATHPMPPGGVRAVRFRRGGASDAVVLDREKPFWERRSANGALLVRAALPFADDCWRFLDERRLAHFFYNGEEQPRIAAPVKRWVLVLHGEDGRILPGHVVPDLPAEKHHCRLAVNESGWIAAAVEVPRIALFDFSLARRAEIDTSAHGARETDVFAVDAAGGVTALVETGPAGKPGRNLVLLRFAPPAR